MNPRLGKRSLCEERGREIGRGEGGLRLDRLFETDFSRRWVGCSAFGSGDGGGGGVCLSLFASLREGREGKLLVSSFDG